MGYGSTGVLVYVDLSDGSIRKETMPEDVYRLYPGGKALAAYLLLKNLPKGVDALGPENVLVLAAGLITGAPVSTATRFTAAAKSPLSGGYGESEAGGYWGPELKMAGIEAVIIRGKAKKPVYIHIRDGEVEIRDAGHLWGQVPEFVQDTIRQELGDKLIRVLQTGIGGENLVRYAGLSHEMRHYNGRTGIGAVMGSKNLKAVSVRGSKRYLQNAFDAKKLGALGKVVAETVEKHPQSWDLHVKGTPGLTTGLNAAGILPTRNFRQGMFEGAGSLGWDAYEQELLKGRGSCYACAVKCKREVGISAKYDVTNKYGGPEYEAVAGFSSNCGVDDLSAMAKANELCNQYILDVISASASIAFAMECFERGLIGLKETEGVDLRFGNADAMILMVEKIAHREGFGNFLAEGSKRMSEAIGQGSGDFAMNVKGEELAMHDPRGKVSVGMGYAVCETGGDHLVSYHDTLLSNPESVPFKGADALGIKEALPVREMSEKKTGNFFLLENWSSLGKVLGFCYFGPVPRSLIQADQVQAAVQAAAGWELSIKDLMEIGERAVNLARIFNIREGFSRAEDKLPERLFQPLENGALNGIGISKTDFEAMMTELYRLKGWDAESTVPDRDRLRQLDIEWAADLLP